VTVRCGNFFIGRKVQLDITSVVVDESKDIGLIEFASHSPNDPLRTASVDSESFPEQLSNVFRNHLQRMWRWCTFRVATTAPMQFTLIGEIFERQDAMPIPTIQLCRRSSSGASQLRNPSDPCVRMPRSLVNSSDSVERTSRLCL